MKTCPIRIGVILNAGFHTMRKKMLFAAALLGVRCFGWAEPELTRKILDAPTEIQGYPCARGYAWFLPDGHLKQCTVSRETAFGEASAPAGSIVVLRLDGTPNYLFLAHDAPVLGYTCKGGGPLGPSEGATTAFYPSGKLKQCWLAEDQVVQGIPCMAAGGFFSAMFHHGGFSTDFYESGKLRSCTLSKNLDGQRRGDVFVQAP